jgi:hypothetical protein
LLTGAKRVRDGHFGQREGNFSCSTPPTEWAGNRSPYLPSQSDPQAWQTFSQQKTRVLRKKNAGLKLGR